MPMTQLLEGRGDWPFGNRLDDLARAYQDARTSTQESRHYNRTALLKRANTTEINVGDSVVLKVAN